LNISEVLRVDVSLLSFFVLALAGALNSFTFYFLSNSPE